MATRIFIHGLESSNKGTKSIYFKEKFPDIIIPWFKGSLSERMKRLNEILADKSNIRMAGSSFGGLMATLFAMENEVQTDRIILLAPAINMLPPDVIKNRVVTVPTWIFHGKNDQVIPLNHVSPIALKIFSELSFNPVDDDHFLHNTFKSIDWNKLLT